MEEEKINQILRLAETSKLEFIHRKGLIPNTIFMNDETYEEIIHSKELYYTSRHPIDFDKFMGLEIVIVREKDKNLKVGLL